MDALRAVKAAVKAFEALQQQYAQLGARDTEPDGTFQWLLVRTFKGKRPPRAYSSRSELEMFDCRRRRHG